AAGSVIKFTPEGGFVANMPEADTIPPTAGAKGLDLRDGMFAEGAIQAYPGMGPFSYRHFGGNNCCVCRVPRFDLDRYGRLVMPNAISTSVQLVDNAGNPILEFGQYGNYDSQYVPPGSKDAKPVVAVPEIPLAWPLGAGISE